MHSASQVPPSRSNRVYVNPNYHQKQPVIHINPEKCGKGIYLNPKLLAPYPPQFQNLEPPKDLSRPSSSIKPIINAKSSSVYVKPELLKQLVSSISNEHLSLTEQKKLPHPTNTQNYKILSKTKLVKSNTPMKKVVSSNFTLLSKRKLVKSSPKSVISGSVLKYKRRSLPDSRKLIVNNRNHVNSAQSLAQTKTNSVSQYKIDRTGISRGSRRSKTSTVTKYKVDRTVGLKGTKKPRGNVVSKYKVDRTGIAKNLRRSRSSLVNSYMVDRTVGAKGVKRRNQCSRNRIRTREIASTIVIEGFSYKSSRNKLVKNPQSTPMRRRSFSMSNSEQFLITKDGKKLHRVVLKTPISAKKNISVTLKNSSHKNVKAPTVPKRSQMNYISTNARQRSLQLMQSKFRKNNQPCLVFRRYGYCPKQERGTCFKVHNKKQVALCQKFLQGKCLSDDCKLSHDIGPEKMPTCKYFLEGCCSKDSCPYRHVKLSDNAPICQEFLEGYCEKGNECKHRHVFVCPEFEKTGSCRKGKHCTYPHKSTQRAKKRKHDTSAKRPPKPRDPPKTAVEPDSAVPGETCKRYYDSSSLPLHSKRAKLLSQMRSLKRVHAEGSCGSDDDDIDSNMYIDSDEEIIVECVRIKKPPLGTLPAFIPID